MRGMEVAQQQRGCGWEVAATQVWFDEDRDASPFSPQYHQGYPMVRSQRLGLPLVLVLFFWRHVDEHPHPEGYLHLKGLIVVVVSWLHRSLHPAFNMIRWWS